MRAALSAALLMTLSAPSWADETRKNPCLGRTEAPTECEIFIVENLVDARAAEEMERIEADLWRARYHAVVEASHAPEPPEAGLPVAPIIVTFLVAFAVGFSTAGILFAR